jgi:hypothetical protein
LFGSVCHWLALHTRCWAVLINCLVGSHTLFSMHAKGCPPHLSST